MYDSKIHHRHSIRIKNYDYSKGGMYFITICTKNKEKILGKITNGKMELNYLGKIVENELNKTNNINENIKIYDYVIMPNHIHFIIEIDCEVNDERAQSCTPTELNKTIGKVIRGIKSAVSSTVKKSIWQRNYYEHVIRKDKEHLQILEYMQNNPSNWELDEDYM